MTRTAATFTGPPPHSDFGAYSQYSCPLFLCGREESTHGRAFHAWCAQVGPRPSPPNLPSAVTPRGLPPPLSPAPLQPRQKNNTTKRSNRTGGARRTPKALKNNGHTKADSPHHGGTANASHLASFFHE